MWWRSNESVPATQISDFIKKQEGDKKFTDEELDSHDKMIADIFKEEDANKDGVISHEEFSGPKHDELWFTTSLLLAGKLKIGLYQTTVVVINYFNTSPQYNWYSVNDVVVQLLF